MSEEVIMSSVVPVAAEHAAGAERLGVTGILSTEELSLLHRRAHALYSRGAYDDAVRYFWFLCLHGPTDTRYLKGLGASLFMAKRFGEAVVTYSFLTMLAPRDAEAHCMCGHSLLMNGEADDARACLEYATRLPGKPEFTGRARALLELISG
jgi:Flp pilus assembly protein TadD